MRGATPFELVQGKVYRGSLALFGEPIYACVVSGQNRRPRLFHCLRWKPYLAHQEHQKNWAELGLELGIFSKGFPAQALITRRALDPESFQQRERP